MPCPTCVHPVYSLVHHDASRHSMSTRPTQVHPHKETHRIERGVLQNATRDLERTEQLCAECAGRASVRGGRKCKVRLRVRR